MAERARRVVSIVAAACVLLFSAVLWSATASGSDGRSHEERTFFNETVTLDQPVDGSVQIYGGDLTIATRITGDVLAIGGNVHFAPGGEVDGDLVYSGGEIPESRTRVHGRIYPLASLEGAAASLQKTAVQLSLLLGWLIAAIGWTFFSGREVRFSSGEIRTNTAHSLLVGLVAMTSFVLSAVVFSMLVPFLVGIPLLAALGVFALLTKIYGMIAVFHAVGTVLVGPKRHEQLATRRWFRGDLAMIVVGVLVLGALRMIPGVGTILWSIASIIGVGVALTTRFGKREPWFLAWRAQEA
jgi:hypothetical protein